MISYIIPRLLHSSLLLDGVVALAFLLARRGLLNIRAVTVAVITTFRGIWNTLAFIRSLLGGVGRGAIWGARHASVTGVVLGQLALCVAVHHTSRGAGFVAADLS